MRVKQVKIREALEVMKERREREIEKETDLLYRFMKHGELTLDVVNQHVEYLTAYFKELNANSRDLTNGTTLTQAFVLSHALSNILA